MKNQRTNTYSNKRNSLLYRDGQWMDTQCSPTLLWEA